MNLCALCLSAPLRETKRRRARRRTASGNHCKAVVAVAGGSGRGEGRLRGNLTQRRGEAESAERKVDTREPVTFQDVSCRHESPAWIACQPHAPLNPMNLCALCLSAPLRESKTTKRTDAGFRGGGRRLLHLVPPFGIMRQTGGAARRRRGGHLRNGTSRRGAERQRAQRGRLRR